MNQPKILFDEVKKNVKFKNDKCDFNCGYLNIKTIEAYCVCKLFKSTLEYDSLNRCEKCFLCFSK
jgi:hypothetical protein